MLSDLFATFILKGRKRAVISALIAASIPFMGWLSSIIVGLVTLQVGAAEGFLILLWTLLPAIVLTCAGMHYLSLNTMLIGGTVVWILAIVLRHTRSWLLVISSAVILGMLVIFGLHLFFPGLHDMWMQLLSKNIYLMAAQFPKSVTPAEIKEVLNNSAPLVAYFCGFRAALLSLGCIFYLMISRYLQSKVIRPISFRQEWLTLRLPPIAVLILGVEIFLAYRFTLAKDFLALFIWPFILVGISIIHRLTLSFPRTMRYVFWIYGISFAIVFLFFPAFIALFLISTGVLLIFITIWDSLLSIRKQIN